MTAQERVKKAAELLMAKPREAYLFNLRLWPSHSFKRSICWATGRDEKAPAAICEEICHLVFPKCKDADRKNFGYCPCTQTMEYPQAVYKLHHVVRKAKAVLEEIERIET